MFLSLKGNKMMEYTDVRLLEMARKICKMLNWYWDTSYEITIKNWAFYLRANNWGINIVETKFVYAVNLVSDLVDKLYILKINQNEWERV